MTVKLTILGCGSSAGVPRIGGDWGRCDPSNPKNRRRRCSVLLTRSGPNGVTRVVIDTSPDMREQMLDASVPDIDGVLFTHEHADHTHGIDELRAYFLLRRRKVEVWADEPTGQMLMTRFAYCFYTAPGSDYPPILNLNRLQAGTPVTIGGAGGESRRFRSVSIMATSTRWASGLAPRPIRPTSTACPTKACLFSRAWICGLWTRSAGRVIPAI